MINLSSFIAFHARRTPDRCALKYRGEDISYGNFDARIRQVGGWLASRGIGAGDVVAVLMKNSAAFLELVFATSHIGAVFLPINYRLSADEVAYIVGNSGARILIADEELADVAAGVAPVVLLDEAAQSTATHLGARYRSRADACPAAARPDAADVHVRDHRPPQGRDAHLRKHLLEIGRSDAGARTERRHAVAGGRPALSCRRARSAGHRRALARRHALHPPQFRTRAGAGRDRSREAQRRLVRACHDDRDPHLPHPRSLRRLQPANGRSAAARRRRRRASAPSPSISAMPATSMPTG